MITLVLRPKGQVVVSESLSRASLLGHTAFSMRWSVVDLWQQRVIDSPNDRQAGMAPWMTLMKTDDPPEVHLHRCRELAETLTDPLQREQLVVVTQIMAAIRYDKILIESVFTREFRMIESPLLEEWTRHRLMREQHSMIVNFLADRFGVGIAEETSTAIRTIKDESRLRVLAKAAATCSSLDQFQITLNATL